VKRLTVLQFDELTSLYIEVEHVQLGKPCLLLVRDSLWATQEAEIRRVLREGFVVHPAGTVPGLEAHWVLVSGAEVVDLVDLELPRFRGHLTIGSASSRERSPHGEDKTPLHAGVPG
jgi:hypothetical protein